MVVKLTERDHGFSELDAQDLFLYICNTAELYHKLTQPIIANLKRKVAKGVYDKSLALKSWKHLADEGARLYDKEFGSGGSSVTLFSPETRMEVARRLQDNYEENILDEGLENKYGEKQYEVLIGTGTAFPYKETVWAYNEQEALDIVVDHLEEIGSAFAMDYYYIYDMCESGQTVDEFVEENNLVPAGNSGLYVDVVDIREV